MQPIYLCLCAVGLLTLMNGIFKGVSDLYHPFQVSFLRYATGSAWILLALAFQRPGWPSRQTLLPNIARGALGAVSGTAFFFGIAELPLADAFSIGFLAPLFVPVLGFLILKEQPRRTDIAALILGFVGMLIIVRGATADTGAARSLFGVGMIALSALTYAASLILLRFLAQRGPLLHLVMFMHVVSAILLAPLTIHVWKAVPIEHLALMSFAALLGVIGHLMMARAFAQMAASRLVPIEYTALIYAALIDYYWFGLPVGLMTLLGAGAIIAGTLMASRR